MRSLLLEAIVRYGLDSKLAKKYSEEDVYWKNAPVYLIAFLLWLQINDLHSSLTIEKLFKAGVLGTIGYRVLDLFLDHGLVSESEVLMGLGLIAEQEALVLEEYGHTQENHRILYRGKYEYFKAEITEKSARYQKCPYSYENALDLGGKATMVWPLFELSLLKLGKFEHLIKYREIFDSISATIQILDDISDLEEDIASGFYTLPTYGYRLPPAPGSIKDYAKTIKTDPAVMWRLHSTCVSLLNNATIKAKELDEWLFAFVAQYILYRAHRAFLGEENLDDPQGTTQKEIHQSYEERNSVAGDS